MVKVKGTKSLDIPCAVLRFNHPMVKVKAMRLTAS